MSGYERSLAYGAPQRITEVKAADDGWEVAGYACTWARDLGNDVVHARRLQDSLASGQRVRFLYAHDADQRAGHARWPCRRTRTACSGASRSARPAWGRTSTPSCTDGSLDSFSIGFLAKDFEHDEKAGVRNLKALDLLEV